MRVNTRYINSTRSCTSSVVVVVAVVFVVVVVAAAVILFIATHASFGTNEKY